VSPIVEDCACARKQYGRLCLHSNKVWQATYQPHLIMPLVSNQHEFWQSYRTMDPKYYPWTMECKYMQRL